MDCQSFSDRRFKCHSVYGKHGEECLHEELTEKRCLSLWHCPKQAKEYYGKASMVQPTTDYDGVTEPYLHNKALCASWAESFAYADKELEYGEKVANHHQEARKIVSNDKALKRECRDVAFALAQCLRYKKLF